VDSRLEKSIAYPTDAKLFHRMREKLVKLAAEHGIELRQSCRRVSKSALFESGRLFHARKPRQARRKIRKLKTYLRRIKNDIARKIAGDAHLLGEFEPFLAMADRLLARKKNDAKKLYSIHAPEVECIAKGKAHKKYEMKNDGRLGRNWLKSEQRDRTNVILSACGRNLRMILARLLLRAHMFLPFFEKFGEIFHQNFRMPSRLPRLLA